MSARKRMVRGLAALAACGGFAIAMASAGGSSASVERTAQRRYAAVAFDYFVLFNPDSVVSAVDRMFPGKGRGFTEVWRTRQFEYSWLRSITGRYADFSVITEDALAYTARAMQVELTAPQKRQLLQAYLHLTPWPDTAAALRRLRESDVRVITIANFSPTMLRSNAENAGLAMLFDALVSTDANHTYKPDPRAYQLGMDRLKLAKEDIVFAAFGGWDAAGAKAFGYPTVWVNRFGQPFEELGVRPDRTVTDLNGLVDFVLSRP
ncbi:MAG TPA: haloacid dehalogenase type II [Vicinamibacterales bacterium]|nr:haloacid dehalogenase type II [Vicinamibacterales bacterium]